MKKYGKIEKNGVVYDCDNPFDRYVFKIETSRNILDYLNNVVGDFSRQAVNDVQKKLVKTNRSSIYGKRK